MKKVVKKAAGGGDGFKSPSYGDAATVSQHHRLATGHVGSVNKPVDKLVPKKHGGKVKKK
jgi:hypothetical protein